MMPPWFWYGMGTVAVVFCVAMARLATRERESTFDENPPVTIKNVTTEQTPLNHRSVQKLNGKWVLVFEDCRYELMAVDETSHSERMPPDSNAFELATNWNKQPKQ